MKIWEWNKAMVNHIYVMSIEGLKSPVTKMTRYILYYVSLDP